MAELKSALCFIFCVCTHLIFVSVQKRQKRTWPRKIFSRIDLTLGVRSCLKTKSRLSSNWRYPLWQQDALWSFQATDCFCGTNSLLLYLCMIFFTCPKPPYSKKYTVSSIIKVCGFVNCSRVLARLCSAWSQHNSLTANLSLPNGTSLNLHKEKVQ